MAITVQYGPIASALGLAQQAGQGQFKFRQQAADLDFLNTVNAMQARADQEHAQEIQQALAQQHLGIDATEANARLRQSADAQASEEDYRNRSLASEDAYRKGTLTQGQQRVGIGQQNVDIAQQRADTGQQNADVAQQKADRPAPDQTRLVYEELRRLDQEERQAINDQQKSAFDPNDLNKLGARPSTAMPNVIAGMEALYNSANQRLQAITARRQQLQAPMNGQTAQPVNHALVQQIAQQGGVMNPQAAGLQAGNQGGTPVIHTAQEYAQLPSGTKYINGNTGQMAVKP